MTQLHTLHWYQHNFLSSQSTTIPLQNDCAVTVHNLPTRKRNKHFLVYSKCRLRYRLVSVCSSPTNNNQRTRAVTGVHSQIILRCGGVKIPHREWAVPPSSIFLWVFFKFGFSRHAVLWRNTHRVYTCLLPILKISIGIECLPIGGQYACSQLQSVVMSDFTRLSTEATR
jgi:hypothetical protein